MSWNWPTRPSAPPSDCPGRAPEALDQLGVYDECYATGRPFTSDATATSQNDADGRLISAGPQRPQWPGAKTAIGVYRPVFLQILADAAAPRGQDPDGHDGANTIDRVGVGPRNDAHRRHDGLVELLVRRGRRLDHHVPGGCRQCLLVDRHGARVASLVAALVLPAADPSVLALQNAAGKVAGERARRAAV